MRYRLRTLLILLALLPPLLGLVAIWLWQPFPVAQKSAPKRGWLGARVDNHATPGQGVVVLSVSTDSPAQSSGLMKADTITSINGKRCQDLSDLNNALNGATPGDTWKMTVTRDGQPKSLVITLGELPRPKIAQ